MLVSSINWSVPLFERKLAEMTNFIKGRQLNTAATSALNILNNSSRVNIKEFCLFNLY